MPRIKWTAEVGSLQWRNNLVLKDGHLIGSTSGSAWNRGDDADGVFSIDAATGRTRWFCRTGSDANELNVFGNTVVCGTDGGGLYAISADVGDVLAKVDLSEPIFARPIEFEPLGMKRYIVAVSSTGRIFGYDEEEKEFVELGKIDAKVRANPLSTKYTERNNYFVVCTEGGDIMSVTLTSNGAKCDLIHSVNYLTPFSRTGFKEAGIFANAAVNENNDLFVGFVRETYFPEPPLICVSIDKNSYAALKWRGQTVDLDDGFGNVRAAPLLAKDEVILAPAYSDSVYAFSAETGRLRWTVRVGPSYFQQWSSPVLGSDGSVYLGRADGILVKINRQRQKVEWTLSASFGVQREVGGLLAKTKSLFEITPPRALDPGEIIEGGICATPLVHNGCIYVGTTSGTLMCVSED